MGGATCRNCGPVCQHDKPKHAFVPTPDAGEYDIPEVVRIFGHEYDVIKTPKLCISENASGTCDTALHKITIDTNFPESHQKETLLHEIIEAINYHTELELEHHKISALSEGLFAVMRNNGLTFCKE